jgi:hypothetical protein
MQSSPTRADQDAIVRAHLLTRLRDSETIRRHTGEDDILHLLGYLADIITRIRSGA